MKRYFGYILAGILLVLFIVLSAVLQFSTSNTVWALCWMAAIILTAWVTTFRNLRSAETWDAKTPYILLIVPLTCGLFGGLVILIAAVFGLIEITLY